jgi:hypothetical protein
MLLPVFCMHCCPAAVHLPRRQNLSSNARTDGKISSRAAQHTTQWLSQLPTARDRQSQAASLNCAFAIILKTWTISSKQRGTSAKPAS